MLEWMKALFSKITIADNLQSDILAKIFVEEKMIFCLFHGTLNIHRRGGFKNRIDTGVL